MPVIVNNSANDLIVGTPANGGSFFDSTRYWFFYYDGSNLRCLYGTDLASLSASNTDGAGNIGGIANGGRNFSIVFGKIAGKYYAWCLFGKGQSSDPRAEIYRWELTSSGLGTPIKWADSVTRGATLFNHCQLTRNYGAGDVTDLYLTMNVYANGFAFNRTNNAALTGDTPAGGVTAANIQFAEHATLFELSDGLLHVQFDQGHNSDINPTGNGRVSEWKKDSEGESWEDEVEVQGTFGIPGNGDFSDQNYAGGTSHAGQQCKGQLNDGRPYFFYADDSDNPDGNHGVLKLCIRGNTQASTWSTASTDVVGSNTQVWHVASTTDGEDIWGFYVKDVSGRDSAIYYRRYDVSEDTWDDESKLADIQAGHSFERMTAPYRFENGAIPMMWSEKNGSVYDGVVGAVTVASPTPAGNSRYYRRQMEAVCTSI